MGIRNPKWVSRTAATYTGWAKNSKPLMIYQLNPVDEATFSLKLNVKQANKVNTNKHLLILNILLIKYSMYNVKCDVNYCVCTVRYG